MLSFQKTKALPGTFRADFGFNAERICVVLVRHRRVVVLLCSLNWWKTTCVGG